MENEQPTERPKRYIKIATSELRELLSYAKRYDFVVFDGWDNKDGEGVWHCDIDFYEDEEAAEQDDPKERFSYDEAETDWETFHRMDIEYTKEDILNVADEIGVDLTEWELNEAERLYEKYESMDNAKRGTIQEVIHMAKKGE